MCCYDTAGLQLLHLDEVVILISVTILAFYFIFKYQINLKNHY